MNADDLRALQAPLKERYREDPTAAGVTLRAEGQLSDNLACSVETGRALVEAGLHPATGGSGLQACSGDMLLQALAGLCPGFDDLDAAGVQPLFKQSANDGACHIAAANEGDGGVGSCDSG